MNVLVYLVPIALFLGLGGLVAFLWSLKDGQYDDLQGAAVRILSDDDLPSANAWITGRFNGEPLDNSCAPPPTTPTPTPETGGDDG